MGADRSIVGKYSIKDILSLEIPYECTFNKEDKSSQVSGVVRMAEDKIRGDFDIEIQSSQTTTRLHFQLCVKCLM